MLAVPLAGGCAADDAERRGTWQAQIDTIGDTVVVRTVAGSVWSGPAELVEELAIGALEGEEELMFGAIQQMAADAHGGVYVFDAQVPALRYYDRTGAFVRQLGRSGSGPGEYRDVALGVAVRRDGRIVLRDPRNARINVYAPTGEPVAHWPDASGLYTADALALDTADHLYLRILLSRPEPNKPWKIGLVHLDANGSVVDTIPDPPFPGEPTTGGGMFAPEKIWTMSPLGDLVVGVSSAYRFEVRRRDGRVLRIEKAHDPVEVLPEERKDLEAQQDWFRKTQARFLTSPIPPVPRTKSVFQSLDVDRRGRIWVRLRTRGVRIDAPRAADPNPDAPPPPRWREPAVYDVFEPDGTYLGEVHAPHRVSLGSFLEDTVWGVRRGELDEQYVVRYRVQNPER